MIEMLTCRLLTTWPMSFLCGLFLTVKNTFLGGRLVPLSYRWLLSSSLFPLRLLHHQSVWWNPLLTRSSLSFFKVAPKNGFHLLFLGLGLAFYQLAMTASAGRVIFNRDRTDWALFSGNCRNISGKCRRPKNLITLHHETDHGKHWTPPDWYVAVGVWEIEFFL